MAARPTLLVVVVLALTACSAGVTQGEPLPGAKAGRLRLHRTANGMYDSSVSWVRHFPFRGPGRYRVTWDWGTGAVSPSIAFEAGPSIRVRPVSVRAGSKVLVYGLADGCPKGDVVTLLSRAFPHTHEFAGVPAVFAKVLAGDRYNHTVGIPAKRRAGNYSITARCGGGNFGVQARLRVR